MKESYIITNGDVIVSDKKEDTVELLKYEYQDNIEDILVVENILEEIGNIKNKKNKTIAEETNTINFINKKFLLKVAVPFGLFGGVCNGIGMLLAHVPIIETLMMCLIASTIAVGVGIIFPIILSKKSTKRFIAGEKLKVNYLEIQEEKYKKLLNELKNNKTKNNINSAKNYTKNRVNHIEKINKIKEELSSLKAVLESEEIYRYCFEQGTLDDELINEYNEEQIEAVKTYFKNNNK